MIASRAMRLWQHIFETDPQGPLAMQAKAAVAGMDILLGNDEAVHASIGRLIADFNDHPGLPQTLFRIGEEYYKKASQMEKEGRNQIRRTKPEILNKSESPKTQNSKQTITSYFDGGYGSRIPISSTKNNKLKDCITEREKFWTRIPKAQVTGQEGKEWNRLTTDFSDLDTD
jgi:hypothetical protein